MAECAGTHGDPPAIDAKSSPAFEDVTDDVFVSMLNLLGVGFARTKSD
jgi:hypothetical protein